MKLKPILLGAVLAASISSAAFAEVCTINSGLTYVGQFCHRGPNARSQVGDITYINNTGKSIKCTVSVNKIDQFPYRTYQLRLKFGNETVSQGQSLQEFTLKAGERKEYKPVEWIWPKAAPANDQPEVDVRDNMHKIVCTFVN